MYKLTMIVSVFFVSNFIYSTYREYKEKFLAADEAGKKSLVHYVNDAGIPYFIEALIHRDEPVLLEMLAIDRNLGDINYEGLIPLQIAAEMNLDTTVRRLLSHGIQLANDEQLKLFLIRIIRNGNVGLFEYVLRVLNPNEAVLKEIELAIDDDSPERSKNQFKRLLRTRLSPLPTSIVSVNRDALIDDLARDLLARDAITEHGLRLSGPLGEAMRRAQAMRDRELAGPAPQETGPSMLGLRQPPPRKRPQSPSSRPRVKRVETSPSAQRIDAFLQRQDVTPPPVPSRSTSLLSWLNSQP